MIDTFHPTSGGSFLGSPFSTSSISVPAPQREYEAFGGLYEVLIINTGAMDVPAEQFADAKKLEADAYVDLFEIILNDKATKIRIKLNDDRNWQGHDYTGTGVRIEGVGSYADDQTSRPTFTLANPASVFSAPVGDGLLENGVVIRYRILKVHLDADLPIYRRQQWRISRVATVKSGFIGLELRDMLDGQQFLVPGRMFIPPDFPAVSLS